VAWVPPINKKRTRFSARRGQVKPFVGYRTQSLTHAQWEAFGIDQGVELASFDLLSGVVTHCVVFTLFLQPLFSADFSDWLAMIAAVGLDIVRNPLNQLPNRFQG